MPEREGQMGPDSRSLEGTTVIVTGASSGIGRSTARALVSEGANVVLSARRLRRLQELADELGSERVAVICGDVRDHDHAHELVSAAKERFASVDSLVANAGIGMYGGILENTNEELAAMVDTNVNGTLWPIRAAVPEMLAGGGGDIVIVASAAGLRGGAKEAVYAATKFAQVGLAGAIDRELREYGIRVTAMCPAAVSTEFAMGKGRTPNMPDLDEWLRPEDIAAAILVVLKQPRRMRTTMWLMKSMVQES